jgi:transcription-repair coupling factor (superfamily II helicase)
MVLEFAEEGRLYIPLEQINRVERYIGGGDGPPPLNHLGTLQWQKTKQQVAQAAQEIARDLLTLYSRRQVIKGFPYSEDTLWQQEMEASFPYLETPDQLKALKDIKGDMIDEKPMDRLLLGDVGYGKTEVAIRAAFKAVQDGKQVAVLVPTTLLAQQHYITFKLRLSAFPVTIESISRFISRKQQLQILDQTANGSLDILIGTHRLLQKDVQFNNLGLIIIDEEQRFGVKHKEYLKEKRQEVDVLTLSATPIPRTLYMSITGVRDLSTIETPPEDR